MTLLCHSQSSANYVMIISDWHVVGYYALEFTILAFLLVNSNKVHDSNAE